MSRFPRAVKSITIVGVEDGSGRDVIYRRRRGKKRSSRGLRPVEKLVRRIANAEKTLGGKYLQRHDRSNQKRANGWLRDIVSNTSRALRPAARKITRL